MKNNYFASDILDLKQYPIAPSMNVFHYYQSETILDFREIHTELAKQQLKDYLRYMMEKKIPTLKNCRSTSHEIWKRWKYCLDFLSLEDTKYTDFLIDFPRLNDEFVNYLLDVRHFKLPYKRTGMHYAPNNLLIGLYHFLKYREEYDKPLWERKIWNIDELHLAPDRINPTSAVKTLCIDYTNDLHDISCLQCYIRYLVIDTKVSFVSIYATNIMIRDFSRFLSSRKKTLTDANRNDVESFYEIYGKTVLHSTLDTRIHNLYHFYEYLQAYGLVKNNPFSMLDCSHERYHYKIKAVEDQVVAALFNVLDKIDDRCRLVFLVMYCTGMRVSEACQLRNNCLVQNQNGLFIVFYCQKMKKDVMNQIPKSLYDMLKEQIIKNSKLEYNEKYVFHRAPNKPFIASSFREKFNHELEPFNLKFSNGESFVFRPHDWRHTLATKLYRSDIDITVIQNVLHHKSIEMTMAYVECTDAQMRRKQHQYLNYRGEKLDDLSEKERIDMMRTSIKAQLLPNGLCSLPVSLGKCPHANTCLDGCEFFRTDKRYLPVHLQYLEDLNRYLDMCDKNGWETQYKAAARVRQNVINLIRGLENE